MYHTMFVGVIITQVPLAVLTVLALYFIIVYAPDECTLHAYFSTFQAWRFMHAFHQ